MHLDIGAYRPAGPTIERFHASSAFFRHIAGPIGSSKTTACCWEHPFTVMMQKPMPDGVRRARTGLLRDTYRNLYGTTLKTWFKSFPKDLGKFVGSDDRPFMHRLRFPAPHIGRDGQPTREWGMCELEVEGRALGQGASEDTVEAVCRGWELSGAQVDEEDLTPSNTFSYLGGRVMRYPSAQYIVSRGVWGAFNKPDFDHYLYQRLVEDLAANTEFFDQPPGLLPGGPPYQTNPDAENLANLPEGYYTISAEGQPEWYVRRMLRNEWGASVSGEPVFPMFRDRGERAHVLPADMWPHPRDELELGMDAGGTPAAVVKGRTPTGRIITYAELVIVDPSDPRKRRLQHGVGPRYFAEKLGELLKYRFPRNPIKVAWADPSSFYGADRERGEYSWGETVGNLLKIPVQPAPSNEIDLRLEAARSGLVRINDVDGMPQKQINPSCTWLRRGYSGDYKYEQRDPKQPGKTLKPQKSATSHVMDADQYGDLGMIGRAGVTAGPKHDRWQPDRARMTYDADPGLGPVAGRLVDDERRDREPGLGSYGTDFDPWRS